MGSLNLKIIFRFLGLTAVLNGVFMFIAIPFSMYHQEVAQMGILNAGIVTVFIGLIPVSYTHLTLPTSDLV